VVKRRTPLARRGLGSLTRGDKRHPEYIYLPDVDARYFEWPEASASLYLGFLLEVD
jgi:hypothetical protein